MRRSRFPLLFAPLPLLLLLAAAAPAEQSCVGDANGNANVTVAELVQAVRGALLGCPAAPAECNGDANCLAGWRAAPAWLALTWLGFEDVRVYDGSWLEWGAGGFPIEVP